MASKRTLEAKKNHSGTYYMKTRRSGIVRSVIEHKRRMQKLCALPVPKTTRNSLLSDYVRHFVFGVYNRPESVSRVAGLQVPFCRVETFEYLFTEVFVRHSYLLNMEKSEPIIYDCGSNIGMSVLFFYLMFPDAQITAFEPQPAAFEKLNEFVLKNNLSGQIQTHQVALSDKCGSIDFFVDDARPGSLLASSDQMRMAKNTISVKAERLSTFVQGPIDLLKLDIEGAELQVLSEMVESGKLLQVKNIVLEYHHHIDAKANNLAQFLRLLECSGFGYQIEAKMRRPFEARYFQDITIFAYAE